MGECGCDTTKMGWLPGPKKLRYVLEVHPGCTNCGTEWGIGVTAVQSGSEDWNEWYYDVPEIVLDARPYHPRQWGACLLDTHALKRMYREETDGDEFDEVNFAFEEFIDRGGLERAFYETLYSRSGARPELEKDGQP